MKLSNRRSAPYASPLTSPCSTGRSILKNGGNPFDVGRAFAEHAERCEGCGNDAVDMFTALPTLVAGDLGEGRSKC